MDATVAMSSIRLPERPLRPKALPRLPEPWSSRSTQLLNSPLGDVSTQSLAADSRG